MTDGIPRTAPWQTDPADGAPAEVVTESTIREVFDADVEVRTGADGVPTVRPRRRGG